MAYVYYSEAQYKRKLKQWRYVKNLKASVCQAIESGSERRELTSATGVVTVDFTPLSPGRLHGR